MSDLICLRFIQRMPPYMPGSLAGFTLSHAQRIVEARRAVYHVPPVGCDEYGKAIKKEAKVEETKPKPKAAPKKEPRSGLKSRKTGKLGTVKK